MASSSFLRYLESIWVLLMTLMRSSGRNFSGFYLTKLAIELIILAFAERVAVFLSARKLLRALRVYSKWMNLISRSESSLKWLKCQRALKHLIRHCKMHFLNSWNNYLSDSKSEERSFVFNSAKFFKYLSYCVTSIYSNRITLN